MCQLAGNEAIDNTMYVWLQALMSQSELLVSPSMAQNSQDSDDYSTPCLSCRQRNLIHFFNIHFYQLTIWVWIRTSDRQSLESC
jgi:hypothetical protein